MKKLLIIVLILISGSLKASTYYLATDGDNGNPGTLASPWLTWQYSLDQLRVGDTLYVRGGSYAITSTLNVAGTYDGTAENPICVFAYPADYALGNVPSIDCSALSNLSGMWIRDTEYWYFKGITIHDAWQKSKEGTINEVYGFNISRANMVNFEMCTAYNIGGYGFEVNQSPTAHFYFTNCDAYNNCDSLSSTSPGNDSGGFPGVGTSEADTTKWTTFHLRGCRSWSNGDSGFGVAYSCNAYFDSCWAWNNGELDGSGKGFSIGLDIGNVPPDDNFILRNCISAYNTQTGFRINASWRVYTPGVKFYNNLAAFNGENNFIAGSPRVPTAASTIYRNNVAYGQPGEIGWYVGYNFAPQAQLVYTSDHNSWDASTDVTVNLLDFESVDTIQLAAPRKADGSLPDITFFQLVSSSDLIDAGTDVGLDYNNDAPDLGYYEYAEFDPVSVPYINTNEPIITRSREVTAGGNMIYDGGGTISAKGVCISQETDPDINDTLIVAGIGTADFTVRVPNLTKSTTYHVRAYATNETGTAYGADVEFTTPASSPVKTGGKLLKHGNYYIKIE